MKKRIETISMVMALLVMGYMTLGIIFLMIPGLESVGIAMMNQSETFWNVLLGILTIAVIGLIVSFEHKGPGPGAGGGGTFH